MSRSAEYEVIVQRASVFVSPLALYIESNPDNVAIILRLEKGARIRGRIVWTTLPDGDSKVRWLKLDNGGYVLPYMLRKAPL